MKEDIKDLKEENKHIRNKSQIGTNFEHLAHIFLHVSNSLISTFFMYACGMYTYVVRVYVCGM